MRTRTLCVFLLRETAIRVDAWRLTFLPSVLTRLSSLAILAFLLLIDLIWGFNLHRLEDRCRHDFRRFFSRECDSPY